MNKRSFSDWELPAYRMEPVVGDNHPIADFMIELEIGNGIARNLATLTDLTNSRMIPTSDGSGFSLADGRMMNLDLEEMIPTPETAMEIADTLAIALLACGKANPTHEILYVFLRSG